jgi:EmrB/QacA subfamily drug resistance transporter
LSLLVGAVSPQRRPLAIGIWGGIAGLGVALGPLLGGAIVEGSSWEGIFWINVPVGILALPLVLSVLPNQRGARARPDYLGVALAGAGLLSIVYGVARGNDAGWDSAEVLGSLIAGAVLIAAFVFWQHRGTAPVLPLRLFRDRSFTVSNLVVFGFSFGMFGAIFIRVQHLQIVQGYSPLDAALLTAPWTMAPVVVAPIAGLLTSRLGTRLLIVVGLVMQSVSLFWLAATLDIDTPYSAMLPAFILAGIGMGLTLAPSSTALLANITDDDTAKASGTNSTLREVGGALGIAVMTAVFTGAGGTLTRTGYVDAAIPALLVGASVLIATAVAAVLLPKGTYPPQDAAAALPEPSELDERVRDVLDNPQPK